jgi:uncharacterized protein (TIGR02145 family)
MKTVSFKYLFSLCFAGLLSVVQIGCRKENRELPVILTLPVTEVTSQSASSGGNITDNGGIDIILKGLLYGRESFLSLSDHTGNISMGGNSEPFVCMITGLLPGSIYFVRAYATSDAGTGYGDLVEFTTLSNPCPGTPTVTDHDGNVYNTVRIGDQCWMSENLKTTTYKSGASIEYPGSDNLAWRSNTTGAYAWNNNDISWKHTYGALYNWYAVTNPEGLCPEGWRMPGYNDWAVLTGTIGGTIAPNGNKLKSCRQEDSPLGGDCNTSVHPRWRSQHTHYGTDDYTFTAIPGGERYFDGSYTKLGDVTTWWSADEHSSSTAWTRQLTYSNGSIGVYYFNKRHGYSVRCLKN